MASPVGFFDQPVVSKRAQRAIEIRRQDPIAAVALLDVADQAPAVAFAVGELEQHVEHERLEREKTIDAVAVLGHERDQYYQIDTSCQIEVYCYTATVVLFTYSKPKRPLTQRLPRVTSLSNGEVTLRSADPGRAP